MSKILAVADIHLHDYPHRNSFPFQRLKQGSEIVAQNIIEVAKKEGCEYIAICGDLIEKSIIRPYVMAAAYKFLYTIMPHFKEGWIIWGNHDIDNKSSDQEETDSCLALFLPDNLHYMHQKKTVLDGKVLGFNNWQPDIDLEWVGDEKLDVLFTHARICYQAGSDLYQSQYLDETKFDIAFCGDIHKPGQIGKYVSIGIPQRCKMSDGEECTGVVIDTTDLSWKWTNLNPDDNLMKFRYVDDQSQEGWNGVFNTWNIYKPDTDKLLDPTSKVSVTGWDKVESLVLDKIREKGLEEVHTEVLGTISDLDSGEVDFNFTLLRFYCKNWRSIKEVTMNFEEGDKILIIGENGSGKSSLLSAIKYAFCDVKSTTGLSSLKPFIQFNEDSCVTEVEFMYQGNKYKLRRGTKEYGLWMNDEPLKYSSKTDFEVDARKRFPFIEYMEVMIHDQDHNQFIGSLPGERLAEIISKAFKLDRIDTYNDAANLLLKNTMTGSKELETKIGEAQKLIDYFDSRLGSIVVPSQSKSELEKLKAEKEEIQRKSYAWNQFLRVSSSLQGSIENLETEKTGLYTKISEFRNPDIVNSEISGFRGEIDKLQSQVVEINGLKNTIIMKKSEMERVINDGKKLRKDIESIDPEKQNYCPTCHQPIPTDSIALLEKKKELQKEIDEVAGKYRQLKAEIDELEKQYGNSGEILKEINSKIGNLNNEITKRLSELSLQEQIKDRLRNVEKKLEDDKNNLKSLGAPEKVEISDPDLFMAELGRINQGIIDWNNYDTICNDKDKQEKLVKGFNVELEKIKGVQENLNAYITLTGPTGEIYESVMQNLVTKFNDSQVKYKVKVKEIRKKNHLTLIPYFIHSEKNEVPYEACSGGQKTVLDIHFLSKIINRVGILILDEFLKHLDPSNHDLCLEMIKEMSIGCTFISSHMESITSFNNKTCSLSLNDDKLTEIDFR